MIIRIRKSIRHQMIEFFQNGENSIPLLPSFQQVNFPSFIRRVANEISGAKKVPFDLAFLGVLAGVAVADQGKMRVRMPDGALLSLSVVMLVGAPSGAGKSRALEEVLSILSELEEEEVVKFKESSATFRVAQDAIKARKSELLRLFAKDGDPRYIEEAIQMEKLLSPSPEPPILLLNDITSAAYMQTLVKTGRACRIESDGIPLPSGCLRQVTKAWAGETSRRSRLTMPDGQVKDPFIVEALFTQPEFFATSMNNQKARTCGLLARTLVYRLASNFPHYGSPRPMNTEVQEELKEKIIAVYKATPPMEGDTAKHNVLDFDEESSKILQDYRLYVDDQKQPDKPLHKIEDFASRMVEHVARIAGLLYLAERAPSFSQPISAEYLYPAMDVINIIAQHHLLWRTVDYVDHIRKCAQDVMLFLLEHNFDRISETVLKQAIKYKYTAADVGIAIDVLIENEHLIDISPVRSIKAGRPTGRILQNPYFDPNIC